MYIQSIGRERIELEAVAMELVAEGGRLAVNAAGLSDRPGRISRAVSAFFGVRAGLEGIDAKALKKEPPVGLFREKASGLMRVVHKELMIRWGAGTSAALRAKILAKHKLHIMSRNTFVQDQEVVQVKGQKKTGEDLIGIANSCMDLEEVVFATPNFVSEFRRDAPIVIPKPQWHLRNTASAAGQLAGEDVKALKAWAKTRGKRTITVAVLDDGVDVDHPNLKVNIRKKPDPNQPRDTVGRDFFIPDDADPEHFNPRPKLFAFPFNQMTGNDIHGTPCAGVIAAAGKNLGAFGIAPKCKILAVKIFHGDNLASDARVADAIRYAALHADILSCSWSGSFSSDIEAALDDAGTLGRGGKGSAVFCASGNESRNRVGFPARSSHAIAVGATTDTGKLAFYSNFGPEISVVAPSSGGIQGIFTTDVSIPNRGFNLGTAAAGGVDGLHTNSFGGTSSATPLAAGVAALVLSVKPNLTRDQLKQHLQSTADKIGPDHDAGTGHSQRFGHGRVNAAKAVQ